MGTTKYTHVVTDPEVTLETVYPGHESCREQFADANKTPRTYHQVGKANLATGSTRSVAAFLPGAEGAVALAKARLNQDQLGTGQAKRTYQRVGRAVTNGGTWDQVVADANLFKAGPTMEAEIVRVAAVDDDTERADLAANIAGGLTTGQYCVFREALKTQRVLLSRDFDSAVRRYWWLVTNTARAHRCHPRRSPYSAMARRYNAAELEAWGFIGVTGYVKTFDPIAYAAKFNRRKPMERPLADIFIGYHGKPEVAYLVPEGVYPGSAPFRNSPLYTLVTAVAQSVKDGTFNQHRTTGVRPAANQVADTDNARKLSAA